MKKPSIGAIKLDGWALLAPMAGVSDLAYRVIARKFGASMTTTEMVSSRGIYHKNEKTMEMLKIAKEEHPVALQLFGNQAEVMAFAAKEVEKTGADIVDINMGCPMQKVVKNGDGCSMMKDIENSAKVVEAMVKAVKIPVTVKMRIGWDRKNLNSKELAKALEDAGAASITVHGRTREEMYSGKADLKAIKEVVQSVKIPVFGNGDITDGKSAKHMMEETGCVGVAIGRAAWGNPWVFKAVNTYIESGEILEDPSWEMRLNMARLHLNKLVEEKGEYTAIREMRAHASHYFHGLPKATALRREIMKCLSEGTFNQVLDLYEEELGISEENV